VYITGYVPVDVTPQTGAKTSKMVELFLAEALSMHPLTLLGNASKSGAI
jgi:hypothetical protein